jgi:hypothetical protein
MDGVAGRTAKQIDAAKKAQTERLGQSGAAGKRKKCKKGKSCGASCIRNNYVCMVDIPWASSSGISKVAAAIQNRPSKKAPKLVPQGQFVAPKLPKAPSDKTPKPLANKVKDKVEKLIKGLRAKGVSISKIREQLKLLREMGAI